eukprot:414984-Amphidinium_carterae.1
MPPNNTETGNCRLRSLEREVPEVHASLAAAEKATDVPLAPDIATLHSTRNSAVPTPTSRSDCTETRGFLGEMCSPRLLPATVHLQEHPVEAEH